MEPKFFYFDLGIVLVDFSVERMLRQIAEVAGLDPDRVSEAIFDSGLQKQHELGRITWREFYESFCQATGARPDYDGLTLAATAIFELNLSMVPVVAQCSQAGHRLGILSNTCQTHWQYCRDRFRVIGETFEVHTLSYEVGATKPDLKIYEAAAEKAGLAPEEIFFVDDMPENVAGAKSAGFDAVQYTTTPALVSDLQKRGVRFKY